MAESNEPKYEPIRRFLAAQIDQTTVYLSLDELEAMVGGLPAEASKPQFWANAKDHHGSRRDVWLGEGFHAFLEPKADRVRFERRSEIPARHDQDWTDDELLACVVAYRELLTVQERGEKASKADIRNSTIAEALSGRSPKAYEFRMQNISSVRRDLGLPIVTGYPPADHVGPNIARRLVEIINNVWDRSEAIEAPTADIEELEVRVFSATRKVRLHEQPIGSLSPRRDVRSARSFVRDPNVIAWVKCAAAGVCESCDNRAPFLDAFGEAYLEVHHVRFLAEGGPDTVDNAVAVCPNCHRKMHHDKNRQGERRRLIKKIERLLDHKAASKAAEGVE